MNRKLEHKMSIAAPLNAHESGKCPKKFKYEPTRRNLKKESKTKLHRAHQMTIMTS